MLTQDTLTDCRFCAEVSKAAAEDPIGTARNVDCWLVMELAQPWTEKMFQEDPRITPLIELFKQLFMKYGVLMSPVLVVPERDYSQPGQTRIMYFERPQDQFAQFEKQEFVVPESETTPLAVAIMKNIIGQPNDLARFQPYRQDTAHVRDIMVCTHGNVDVACARFGFPIYKTLKDKYAAQSDGTLRVWRCSHFGGHKFAPTLIDLPTGQYWGHLEPDVLDALVHRQGEVKQLRSHYRGWSGLGKFEQIAERDIWMEQGWDWLSCHKSGKTLNKGLKGIKRYLYPMLKWVPLKRAQVLLEQWTNDATWAEVRVDFRDPIQGISGTYQARIEGCGEVMTAAKSPKQGEEMQLAAVSQYRVSHLERKG
ncbi:MAG: sucrase ferredoxin [Cyanothece sp. SIO2G6]|nr:sucrase ferredoxin [Cyanothece sp. SIO2G6]